MKLTLIVATFCLHCLPYEVFGTAPEASLYCPLNPNDQNALVEDDHLTNCTYYCEVQAPLDGKKCDASRRGRNLKTVHTDDLVNEAGPKCLNAEYDLFVVSERNHFALLATPPHRTAVAALT
jgi:hypothetical protein